MGSHLEEVAIDVSCRHCQHPWLDQGLAIPQSLTEGRLFSRRFEALGSLTQPYPCVNVDSYRGAFILCVCPHACAYVCASLTDVIVHVWGSEVNPVESFLLPHLHTGSGDQTRVIRLIQ